jgi:hypothetical protein
MKKQQSKQNDQRKPQPKKPYNRPELNKHGNVESLTQGQYGGPSCPIDLPR